MSFIRIIQYEMGAIMRRLLRVYADDQSKLILLINSQILSS